MNVWCIAAQSSAILELHTEPPQNNFQQNLPTPCRLMIKGFLIALIKFLACDLAMHECAVNRSIFLAKNSINSNFTINILTIVVLSVDSHC